ncbi:MAG: ATP-binding protein [Pyrinomonadaceae bacterium]
MREIRSINIKDEAEVGAARRAVHQYAREIGFTDTELAEIDIVVQEIGTNAVRYAKDGGALHFATPLESTAISGLELFYCDKGPGIYNLDRAVRDGVSSSGSLGSGLGAIRRLMDEFEVYSTVRSTARLSLANMRRTTHGTALLARKWTAAAKSHKRAMNNTSDAGDALTLKHRIGAWSRPYPGEDANGDAYYVRTREAQTLLAVVDGLGHGHGAQVAANVVLGLLDEWAGEPVGEILMAAHEALRATRGAVMSVVVIDTESNRFHYAGVGNVLARAFDTPERISLISSNGTLGSRLGTVRVWTNAWSAGTTIVMASDGLSATWDMALYPGLLQKSPQLLAGVLMRDYARETDDATILVVR